MSKGKRNQVRRKLARMSQMEQMRKQREKEERTAPPPVAVAPGQFNNIRLYNQFARAMERAATYRKAPTK